MFGIHIFDWDAYPPAFEKMSIYQPQIALVSKLEQWHRISPIHLRCRARPGDTFQQCLTMAEMEVSQRFMTPWRSCCGEKGGPSKVSNWHSAPALVHRL